MDRRSRLLQGINVRNSTGIEIGALCSPFVEKSDGNVIYVDHADTETLRAKYRTDPDVNLDKLVEVDGVWGSNTLFEAAGRQVDYVIASHVVEHVPNLIGWFREIAWVLAPGGVVRLIVPDKRFTFDYLRDETKLSDVVYANMVSARIPLPHLVLDYVLNVVKVDRYAAWAAKVDVTQLEHHHSLDHALRVAREVVDDQAYHDVHCWVFTPRSFALLFAELVEHGLLNFECSGFFDTEPNSLEFFVGLRSSSDPVRASASWRSMADSASAELQTVSAIESPRFISQLRRYLSRFNC